MKRTIIRIDEAACNGCGQCVPGCPEGALQIINGKARLISDLCCDGLGACIGECPQGAITIEEREAAPYDERRVMDNIISGGADVIRAHLQHLADHGQQEYLQQAQAVLRERGIKVDAQGSAPAAAGQGCPGMRAASIKKPATPQKRPADAAAPSELSNWPLQLRLINPDAPYFENAHLLVAADCAPFALANFHSRLLMGKTVVMFCPKLDTALDAYVEKLAEIFQKHAIQSVTVVHMEVPCCSGVGRVVAEALQRAGKAIPVRDVTISIQGEMHE